MTTTAAAGGRSLISDDPENNVTPYIEKLVGRNLHLMESHPLNIIKRKIEGYFESLDQGFETFDALDPGTAHAMRVRRARARAARGGAHGPPPIVLARGRAHARSRHDDRLL